MSTQALVHCLKLAKRYVYNTFFFSVAKCGLCFSGCCTFSRRPRPDWFPRSTRVCIVRSLAVDGAPCASRSVYGLSVGIFFSVCLVCLCGERQARETKRRSHAAYQHVNSMETFCAAKNQTIACTYTQHKHSSAIFSCNTLTILLMECRSQYYMLYYIYDYILIRYRYVYIITTIAGSFTCELKYFAVAGGSVNVYGSSGNRGTC